MSSSRKSRVPKRALPYREVPAPAPEVVAIPEAPATVQTASETGELAPAAVPGAAPGPGERSAAVVLSGGSEAEDQLPSLPFLVAGIGVAAGGEEALRELLQSLLPYSGLALVILPAESAQKVELRELVSGLTDLPVHQATTGLHLLPNHLYVPPPDTFLRIEAGKFVVIPRPAEHLGLLVIDPFLLSLAADLRNRAIGILLTGCEGDGAPGLKAIKGEGGITIVEREDPTRSADAPQPGRAGTVDLLLSAAQIGEELGRIARQLNGMLAHVAELADNAADEPLLAKIYLLLHKATRVDFSFYKQTTLRRRIARRMVVKRVGTLHEYARFLQVNADELKELYEDMLINVTRFFRDPETFAALRADLLPLLAQERSPGQPIRIWVPGCATGEEVYSLAITLLEHLGTVRFDLPIQLFGTDISDKSIDIARTAIYPESLMAELSPERLKRFFVKLDGGYQVVKRLRDLCVFARQNLASDPPFSHLDLISCRNVLIYFGPTLQKTIIQTFHYALKSTGFLLLGNSETIRDYSNLFVLLDKRHKFYAKNPNAGPTALQLAGRSLAFELPESARSERSGAKEAWSEVELQRAADRIVLARFGPAGVIINERAEILQSRGHTSPFIELPSGTATLNLLRMVKENIAIELRGGISRAVADNIPVRLDDLWLPLPERRSTVTIEILPILSQGQSTRCFLVMFIPGVAESSLVPTAPPLFTTGDNPDKEILQLRSDLASTKLYLQSLLEERDIANQELISANEEIQSSNEELQSINEELETAKEELQSTNEELQTVNEELFNRNLELAQTSNDLLNLLNNITIPVLMLDSELRIRQFTPIAERMMNVRSSDIGRSIGEIRLNLTLDNLEPLLAEVIDSLTTKELEVQDRAGRWHLLRARPYRTADHKIDGVVIVLVEIDQIRKSQQQLVEARDFAQAVIASVQIPLAVLNRELRIKMANRSFYGLCGLPFSEVEGHLFHELAARHWHLEPIRPLLETLPERPIAQAEFELEHETGGVNLQVLQINARAIVVDGEWLVLLAMQNVTARKLAERLLRREKERLEGRMLVTERALDRTQEELRALAASLFDAQEEERRRVARELHDDLAQKVALLDLTTERIQQALRAAAPNADSQMEELRQQITELSLDLRRIAYQLHPTILDDLGLSFALKQLVEEFGQREGLPVHFSSRAAPSVPPTVGGALYRITQEALRNIAKHAGKTAVEVTLVYSRRELRLSICDHGRGFEPGEARSRGGMGILNMEERVRLLGGRFTLKAQPGKGVTILVRVALPPPPPPGSANESS